LQSDDIEMGCRRGFQASKTVLSVGRDV
jgi:hypothetical protein